jgi:hypothetical protein
MIMEAVDTTLVSAAKTVADTASQQEYSIGRIIPLPGTTHDNTSQYFTGRESPANYFSASGRVGGLPRPQEIINTDFGFIVLSSAFFILTILAFFGRKSLTSYFKSLVLKHHTERFSQASTDVISWQPALRNLFSVINISLFAVIALLFTNILKYNEPSASVRLTGIIAGSFLAGLLLRHFACIVVSEFTGWKSLFREYVQVIYNSWFTAALILFFLSAIILFAPVDNPIPAIFTGIAASAIVLIIRIVKLLIIFLNAHISILYFILYLCALEILPVLVILKLIGVF